MSILIINKKSKKSVYTIITAALLIVCTILAFGKIAVANAEDNVDYWANFDYQTAYDVAVSGVANNKLYGEGYLNEHPYRVVVRGWSEQNYFSSVYFFAEPVHFTGVDYWNHKMYDIPETLCVNVSDSFVVDSYSTRTQIPVSTVSLRYSTYSVYDGDETIYETLVYSLDAPYVQYDEVTVRNKIADGDTKVKLFDDIYEDYTMTSKWTYKGLMKNIDIQADKAYKLEVDFVVELPTDGYIADLAEDVGIDLSKERNALNFTPSMVEVWNSDKRCPVCVYEFTYLFDVVPNEYGYFEYGLTFNEIETLIRYFNEEGLVRFREYDSEDNSYWKAILLSYLHIDTVKTVVKTERDGFSVYGKGVVNVFERGIYDVCMEIAPDVDINDYTDEELDNIVQDAVQDANDKYLQDLENRVEELEKEFDGSTNLFSGDNLWLAFKSVGTGLLSMLTAVSRIPRAFGAVFTFFPPETQEFMGYVLIASFVIILWKLAKK